MIIVITGASSFLGKAALKKFNDGCNEVIAFRHSFEEEEEKLPLHIDVWLHFAWAGKGSAGRSDGNIQKFNIEMSMRALKKAQELSCGRFLFAGSQAEYGKQGGSEYGRAKALFSKMAAAYLFENDSKMLFLHLRIFSVYGPGDREGTLIDTITSNAWVNFSGCKNDGTEEKNAEVNLTRCENNVDDKAADKKNEPIVLGPCTQLWNYIYIDDLADALYLLSIVKSDTIRDIISRENKRRNIESSNAQKKNADAGSEAAASDEVNVRSEAVAEEENKTKNLCVYSKNELIIDIGGKETAPLCEYVKRAAKICGCTDRLRFGERADNAEGAADLVPDLTVLSELGFIEKTDFETGIENILESKTFTK